MTKMTFALAAALLAGSTMTNAAHAGGIRLGFGFPLGTFIAHSTENYGGGDYGHYEKPRYVRRDYDDDAAARKIAKIKRAPKVEVADTPAKPAPVVQTAKLEDKLASDPATTTVIEKTPAKETTVSASNKTATTDTVATATKTETSAKSDAQPATSDSSDTKHICRRYSAAIAELVDVPCE